MDFLAVLFQTKRQKRGFILMAKRQNNEKTSKLTLLSDQYRELLPAPRQINKLGSLEQDYLGTDEPGTGWRLVLTYGAHEEPIC